MPAGGTWPLRPRTLFCSLTMKNPKHLECAFIGTQQTPVAKGLDLPKLQFPYLLNSGYWFKSRDSNHRDTVVTNWASCFFPFISFPGVQTSPQSRPNNRRSVVSSLCQITVCIINRHFTFINSRCSRNENEVRQKLLVAQGISTLFFFLSKTPFCSNYPMFS